MVGYSSVSSEAFHKKCDIKTNTFTVISTVSGSVFGGYIDKTLNESGTCMNTKEARLFS